jgi:formate dehydrogenase
MAKVVCVLYEDPVTGYPGSYARDDIPAIEPSTSSYITPIGTGYRIRSSKNST